ncbi:hypothetical protein EG834_00260 [bacterium]|nr:hypothetical protein [bacterium]
MTPRANKIIGLLVLLLLAHPVLANNTLLTKRILSTLPQCWFDEGLTVRRTGEYADLYAAGCRAFVGDSAWRITSDKSDTPESFQVWLRDLNSDGLREAIVFTEWQLRGAQGNGDILIFQRNRKASGSWVLIGRLSGNAVYIERTLKSRYVNILTHWHMGVDNGMITRYSYYLDSLHYRARDSVEYHHDE